MLEASCSPTPFWAFNQHRTFALQFPYQNIVGNSFPVSFHSEHLVSFHGAYIILRNDEFHNGFPMIGKMFFRLLAKKNYDGWLELNPAIGKSICYIIKIGIQLQFL